MARGSSGPCKGGCGRYVAYVRADEALRYLRTAQAESRTKGMAYAFGGVDFVTRGLAGLCPPCDAQAQRREIVRALPIPELPTEAAQEAA